MAENSAPAAADRAEVIAAAVRRYGEGIRQTYDDVGRVTGFASGILNAMGPAIEVSTRLQRLATITGTAPDTLTSYIAPLNETATQTGGDAARLTAAFEVLVRNRTDPAGALETVQVIARTDQATGAGVEALTGGAIGLAREMALDPAEIGIAFEMLNRAGVAGRVTDFRSAVPALPALAGTAAGIGLTGTGGVASLAAALQIAGADGAEATAGMAALLQALKSRAVSTRADALGVDIRAAVQAAQATGADPLRRVLDDIRRATGGNLPDLDALFGDELAASTAARLMTGGEDYDRLRTSVLSAGAGLPGRGGVAQGAPPGSLEAAAARVGESAGGSVQRMTAAWEGSVSALLTAMEPDLARIADVVTDLLNGINRLIEAMPGLTSALVLAAGTATVAGTVGGVAGRVGGVAKTAGGLIARLGSGAGIMRWLMPLIGPVVMSTVAKPQVLAALAATGLIVYFWDDIVATGNELLSGASTDRAGSHGNVVSLPMPSFDGGIIRQDGTEEQVAPLPQLMPPQPVMTATGHTPPAISHTWNVTINVTGPADGQRIASEFRQGVLNNDWGVLYDHDL
ncbi:phage tail tape measure protein (plasmid) [Tistrella mobilis]|uniref:phage tail tape measure protein n=1 Tax=Tistrella mobilis TaxID=171437 RepID=UPI003556C4C0